MTFLNCRTDAELLQIINDESLDYDIRIHATKELIAREKIKKAYNATRQSQARKGVVIMTAAERREKYLLNEFDRIFESLEYRLFEHLAAADHIVAKIISEASTAGVGLSTIQKVVRAKIEDMIDQIAEKRELETPKRARKDSK